MIAQASGPLNAQANVLLNAQANVPKSGDFGYHIFGESIQWHKRTWLQAFSMALAFASLCGCGDMFGSGEYGAVRSPESMRALNGLGAHQRMWESAGAKCIAPTKLSPLLDNVDAIVLVARTYAPPGARARDWLEQWLREQEGRSVIYFGRDFDAGLYYREQTLTLVSADERERARQLWALDAAARFGDRVSHMSQGIFCRWFYRGVDFDLERVSKFTGPWAKDLATANGFWPIAVPLQPPTGQVRQLALKAMNIKSKKSTPASRAKSRSNANNLVFRSIWSEDEIDSIQALDEEWRKAPEAEVLLASEKQTPLVTQLTSPVFPDSRILIVANGAPLLNGSLTSQLHRRIGQMIIEQCLPAKRVAFLAYDEAGILISNIEEKDPRVSGLEMLTIWPLSILTIHAALLGILVCMALLPVLGRPQQLPQRALSDFGHHVEAMGNMLHQANDRNYAYKAITDYFRSVRGEPGPAWAQPEAGLIKTEPSALVSDVRGGTDPAQGPRLAPTAHEDSALSAVRSETVAGPQSLQALPTNELPHTDSAKHD